MACVSSAPPAMALPSGRVGGCFADTMHHPFARRPISFAPGPRFLLNPVEDEELSPPTTITNRKKRYRTSLPSSSGRGSERGRDIAAAEAGFDIRVRKQAYANEDTKTSPPRHFGRGIGEPNDMAKLITLVLQPRAHHKRNSSLSSLVETIQNAPRSPSPAKSSRRTLSAVPKGIRVFYSIEEWKGAMEAVKMLFARRHWKRCAARCKQLLVDCQHQTHIHSTYTIYLTFYIAISLEQTARSLPNASPLKLPLLRESLTYLHQSKTFIPTAFHITTRQFSQHFSRTTPSPTRTSLTSSDRSSTSSARSLFSPVSATSSSASPPCSPDSSPFYRCHSRQSSVVAFSHKRSASSTSSAILRPAPLRIQKKVSFSSTLDTLISNLSESRETQELSLNKHGEAENGQRRIMEVENWNLIDCFPMPPSPSLCPSLVADSESEDEDISCSLSSTSFEEQSHHSASLERFHTSLRGFEGQNGWHIRSVEEQISTLSNGECPYSFSEGESDGGKAELLRRIQRRRECGWKRDRFDGRRYQELCERVLEEVDGVMIRS